MIIEEYRDELKKCFSNFDKKLAPSLNLDFKFIINSRNMPGFLPYYSGKFNVNIEFEEEGILVLAKDFGSEDYKEIKDGKNVNQTFRQLKKTIYELLYAKTYSKDKELKNDDSKKFILSNIFTGLRKGKSNSGPFLESFNIEYLQVCKRVVELQIEIFKPKIILALGQDSYQFLTNNFCTKFNTKERVFSDEDKFLYSINNNYTEYYSDFKVVEIEIGKRQLKLFSMPHPRSMSSIHVRKILDDEVKKKLKEKLKF